MKYSIRYTLCIAAIAIFNSCSKNTENQVFQSLSSSETGIDFKNVSLEKSELNVFNYRNFYNGGGVAIGDVNNDGFPDIFFTSNFEENKLFLNKGNSNGESLKFEDITKKSGITKKKFWSTGVTFADVNGDGWQDIYVCNSGSVDNRGNELYINNGLSNKNDPSSITFTEKAQEYGLVDGGFSTHAAFFDFDKDGDLDMYLLNNSFIPIEKLQYAEIRNQREPLGGDKLFRNDGGHFTDISQAAGIYGAINGFGLGITIGDVNNDNWLDIYISNDFYERDFLYINQKDGTFKESMKDYFQHISLSSMGADIADMNNDGNLDIFVTDMLPKNDKRLKTTMLFESYELDRMKQERDFYHQYSQNMLHLNNGNGTFTEVAQAAGVHATDWSWGALLFDMDNDGLKDVFVANGILKDLTDQDYVMFLENNPEARLMLEGKKKFDFREFVKKMTSTPLANFAFKNNSESGIDFTNKATDWGLGEPSFSNGAAYGDLDNDGDLDLVVNNNNSVASVFKNLSVEKFKKNYLKVALKGADKNPFAIGTKVYVHQKGKTQFLQQMPNRGFESSVDLSMVFGLNNDTQVDSVVVVWQNDKQQVLKNIKANQKITLEQKNATQPFIAPTLPTKKLFEDVTEKALNFTHQESNFVDYNRDLFLKQQFSTQGPAMAVGDINGDGLDDVFFGGAAGFASKTFVQANSKFIEKPQPEMAKRSYTECVAATFFDADNDKDLDLYIATGSNEFETNAPETIDFLYINDGKGNFTLSQGMMGMMENNSCVTTADFDKDGDNDIFVGSRIVSGEYGKTPKQTLLINDGKGNFTPLNNPKLADIGMVTDAAWIDMDNDKYLDLVMVGDWMGITVVKNEKGKLNFNQTKTTENSEGWWNVMKPVDINKDGLMDLVIGNLGINSKMKASIDLPSYLYGNDYDKNGLFEQLMTCNIDGKDAVMMQRNDLVKRLPKLKDKFLKHEKYATADYETIFSEEERNGQIKKEAKEQRTMLAINDGKGGFILKPLPMEAQLSPIFGIVTGDYDNNGKTDLILTGNFFDVLPELARYDGNYGLVLSGDDKGNFKTIKNTGFFTKGQVRKMATAKGPNGKEFYVLAKNNDKAQVFVR
jgi:enediyne biosynthesis protein E4